ncbi:MAG TPA: hypothetical protein VGB41_07285 [Acidimicrobiia bacterium]
MTGALLVVAFAAAFNPFRSRGALPETSDGRGRAVPLLVGGALAVASVAALAWWSGPVLRTLQITPETFKIAAGFVAVLAGGYAFVVAVPSAEPELGGWRAGVWPVWYPRLLGPEVIVLALTAGAGNGVAATSWSAAAAVTALFALAPMHGRVTRRVLVWFGRILSAALVVVGVWLTIDGIRDV